MFRKVGLAVLFLIACVLANDSLAISQGIQTAGTVATAVAAATNNTEYMGLIQTAVAVALSIVSFIFGHKHGKDSK